MSELSTQIGELYHKHVYRHIAKAAGTITDSTNFCISDIVNGIMVYQKEVVVLLTALLGYRVVSDALQAQEVAGGNPDISSNIAQIVAGAALATATLMGTYGLNYLRKPFSKRIDIEPSKCDQATDLAFTVAKLNSLAHHPRVDFTELNDRINQAVNALQLKTDGYEVCSAQKVKKSAFSKALIQARCLGMMNPFLHEIMVTSEDYPEIIAHEKAHLIGYPCETDAQLFAFVAMLESEDELLHYYAYLLRLSLHLDSSTRTTKHDEYLQSIGLNEQSSQELIDRRNRSIKISKSLTRYGKFKNSVGYFFRSFALKKTGQGNLQEAYFSKPLRFIQAYDPPTDAK